MDDSEIKSLAETADPSEGRWSQTEMLLALLVDRVGQLIHVTAGAKGKPPEPYPRPGVKPKGRRKRKPLTPEQAERLYRVINGPDAE